MQLRPPWSCGHQPPPESRAMFSVAESTRSNAALRNSEHGVVRSTLAVRTPSVPLVQYHPVTGSGSAARLTPPRSYAMAVGLAAMRTVSVLRSESCGFRQCGSRKLHFAGDHHESLLGAGRSDGIQLIIVSPMPRQKSIGTWSRHRCFWSP